MLTHCTECGNQVSDRAAACPHCGAPVMPAVSPSGQRGIATPVLVASPKSRSAAVLLAVFLGGLGIHKFYLNRPGWGVLYLLFCWTFVPVIVGFIEGLMYLGMSEADFQAKYGRPPG
jgi:TM2 domain-containing membrane protein YozV